MGSQGGITGNKGGNARNQGSNDRNHGGNEGNNGDNHQIGVELMNYNCGEGQETRNCVSFYSVNVQRLPSIGVLQNFYSAKTKQIHGRPPMQKWDFEKVHGKNSHKSSFLGMSTSLDLD